MDSLASNPSGGSGIYNGGSKPDYNGALSIVNQLKDREMKDFRDKANFMSDLTLKQDRLSKLFDPSWQREQIQEAQQMQQGGQNSTQGMNTVMAADPNTMTGYQKGELGIRQQEANIDSQRLTQTGKLGQQALDIKGEQQDLNQQKSDQINAQKQSDMERKINDSTQKLELAQKALEARTKAGEDTLQAHKDLAAAVEERHNLERENTKRELDQKDAAFEELKKQHQALIDQNANSTSTTTDSTGASRTTKTQKGSAQADPLRQADGSYNVVGPNGQKLNIPANKLDDWMTNHQSGTK